MNFSDRLSEGFQHQQNGRYQQAKEIYEEVLSGDPENPEALYLIGMLALQTGFVQPATQYLIHALNFGNTQPDLFANLAMMLRAQNNITDAHKVLLHGLSIIPDDVILMTMLGTLLRDTHHYDKSLKALQHAIELEEASPSHLELARTLLAMDRQDQAEIHFKKSISLESNGTNNYFYGLFLAYAGQNEAAIEQFKKALTYDPNSQIVLHNLGFNLYTHGQRDESLETFLHCLKINPNNSDAHALYAFPLLLSGQYEQGWKEYEWRFKTLSFPPPPLTLESPVWKNEPIKDKTILLLGEQGYGDTFQFVRFADQLSAMGAKVLVAAPDPVLGILKGVPGVDDVFSFSESNVPDHDYHIYMMSLPERLGITLPSLSKTTIPYLFADQQLCKTWKDFFTSHKKFNIGIVWNGNPDQRTNKKRSCPLSALSPLFDLEDVQLFSLAKTRPQDEGPLPDQMIDLGEHLHSFSDTAAIMQNLDLVISVCTSTAHLAGALGRPVWVLLAASADWRWLLDRDDSPWYPTARLMRQETLHDWDHLIQKVAKDLSLQERQKLLS